MRILFIDLDTLRPDHLGCYGYHRNTSPNLDRLAAEGVRFDNYFCSDAPCLPSRAALTSGQFGIHSGVVGHGGTAADMRLEGADRGFQDWSRKQSLAGTLGRGGLKTATISPFAERHTAWWWYAGFNEVHNPAGKCGNESAEELTPTIVQWIEDHGKQDSWFLHFNYWDPHTVYRAPAEFGNPFANDPLPAWLTEDVLAEHRRHVGPHSAREISMWNDKTWPQWPRQPGELRTMADVRQMIDGYDCGIRYADQHVGYVLDALKKQGVLDETIIIVSSDHGENQGELGVYGEHGTADQITHRIPMIVRWPGMKRGHVDTGLHYNLDLLPTLAEMLGVEPSPRWDGRSYAAALRDGTDCGRDYLVLSQCCHVCQRSVRFGPWLWMRSLHDGFHMFPREMLFHISSDPHEQRNVAAANPDVCRQAAHLYVQWHDEMMLSMPYPYDTDPLWTVMKEGGPMHARGMLPSYIERLKKTDRGAAEEELRKHHPREFKPPHRW
jgi:arylsulfatase A-like enzyme